MITLWGGNSVGRAFRREQRPTFIQNILGSVMRTQMALNGWNYPFVLEQTSHFTSCYSCHLLILRCPATIFEIAPLRAVLFLPTLTTCVKAEQDLLVLKSNLNDQLGIFRPILHQNGGFLLGNQQML